MAFTKCWLAYPEIRGCHCDAISLHTELMGETIDRAKAELAEGFKGLYGAALTEGDDITLALDMALDPEGYRLKAADGHCTIEGGSEVGVLYGVFALLRNLQTAGKAWAQFTADEEKAPSNRLRMLNHWDNMDGSIERGYSGDSFFFKDSEILIDVPRLTAYARMLASVGINGITINNVNVKDAASWLITDRYFGALQEYPLPQIIIDMGTATTFSVIDQHGFYVGGMITAGMAISAEALVRSTSQLSKVDFEKPKKLIGTNTVDCVKSGLLYATACSIDGMAERIETELGQPCTVIITGGLAGVIKPLCKRGMILDEDLILKGLLHIYHKNCR